MLRIYKILGLQRSFTAAYGPGGLLPPAQRLPWSRQWDGSPSSSAARSLFSRCLTCSCCAVNKAQSTKPSSLPVIWRCFVCSSCAHSGYWSLRCCEMRTDVVGNKPKGRSHDPFRFAVSAAQGAASRSFSRLSLHPFALLDPGWCCASQVAPQNRGNAASIGDALRMENLWPLSPKCLGSQSSAFSISYVTARS